MPQNLKKYWPLILIVTIGTILRLYKIEDLFYFTYDESIPAFVGRRMFLWGHIPLIGGVTPFGVHLAPYFYWLLSALIGLANFNPIIWGYAGAFISIFTTGLIYTVGSKFSSKTTGFVAAAIWTFSYLANIYDRRFWALYWGPIVSLITIFSLYQIINKKEKFTYPLALTLAFAIHADPSNLVFLAFTFLVWIIFKLPITKTTLLGIVIIALSFFPLAVFDLRHNFANTKPLFDFVQTGKNKPGINLQKATDNALLFPKSFSRLVYTSSDNEISKQYSYCLQYAKGKLTSIPWYVTFASSVFLLIFIAYSFKRNTHVGWKLISLLLLLYFAGIQIYGTIFKADIFEHYITGTFALFVLVLAKSISMLPRKLIIVVLAVFVTLNVQKILSAKNDLGLSSKRQAIEYTMQKIGDKPFSLDSLSTCWKLNGYRYLFAAYGREPVKSYVDPNLSYLYGTTQVWDKHPETVVAFVGHDFVPETKEFYKRYALLKSHEVESNIFGALEVIIMDNSSN